VKGDSDPPESGIGRKVNIKEIADAIINYTKYHKILALFQSVRVVAGQKMFNITRYS
jgi:hypothetical protein